VGGNLILMSRGLATAAAAIGAGGTSHKETCPAIARRANATVAFSLIVQVQRSVYRIAYPIQQQEVAAKIRLFAGELRFRNADADCSDYAACEACRVSFLI
jgi:hypothetical protein